MMTAVAVIILIQKQGSVLCSRWFEPTALQKAILPQGFHPPSGCLVCRLLHTTPSVLLILVFSLSLLGFFFFFWLTFGSVFHLTVECFRLKRQWKMTLGFGFWRILGSLGEERDRGEHAGCLISRVVLCVAELLNIFVEFSSLEDFFMVSMTLRKRSNEIELGFLGQVA